MFTGLVEGRGIVSDIRSEGASIRLVIQVPDEFLSETRQPIGDSISINGCCLTVVHAEHCKWSFQAGAETLSKTNLCHLKHYDFVNLERSLPVDGRLGGHFVQGHVDGTGEVAAIDRDGEWVTIWFRVAESLAGQMVSKGSVAVDGISLTVVAAEHDRFSVALIPHTLQHTTLGLRKVGDTVNVETDILGKYVARLLATGYGLQATAGEDATRGGMQRGRGGMMGEEDVRRMKGEG